jgi:hypothetical protein
VVAAFIHGVTADSVIGLGMVRCVQQTTPQTCAYRKLRLLPQSTLSQCYMP